MLMMTGIRIVGIAAAHRTSVDGGLQIPRPLMLLLLLKLRRPRVIRFHRGWVTWVVVNTRKAFP